MQCISGHNGNGFSNLNSLNVGNFRLKEERVREEIEEKDEWETRDRKNKVREIFLLNLEYHCPDHHIAFKINFKPDIWNKCHAWNITKWENPFT